MSIDPIADALALIDAMVIHHGLDGQESECGRAAIKIQELLRLASKPTIQPIIPLQVSQSEKDRDAEWWDRWLSFDIVRKPKDR